MAARATSAMALAMLVAACSAAATPPPGTPGGAGTGANGATAAAAASASSGGTAAPDIDACTVLTDEEILTATGQAVTAREPSTLTQVFSSVCDVKLRDSGEVTVGVLSSGGRRMWEDSFKRTIGTEVLDEAVSGLGDAAAMANENELMVLQGDVLFDIVYSAYGRTDKLQAVRQLAGRMVSSLGGTSTGDAASPGAPPTSAGPAIDACALLTEAEIKEATHFAATANGLSAEGPPAVCRWELQTGESLAGLHAIELAVLPSGGRKRFDILAPAMQRLTGLGDDAAMSGGNTGGSFLVVVGDRLLTVTYSLPVETVDPEPLVRPLLEKALTRLG